MEDSNVANSDQIRVKGIKDLVDSKYSDTDESLSCTLILTDGHAAKSLAIAGLSKIPSERDWYGVYPLERRLINVSKTKRPDVERNAVVRRLVAILGLRFNGSYKTEEDFRTLRYGQVLLMMDRDEDGSHKKGLLINLFRCCWPDLFRVGFIQQFIAPIYETYNDYGHIDFFYSFEDYQEATRGLNRHLFSTKIYESLESFKSLQIKSFFSDLRRHRVQFTYEGEVDFESFRLAFDEGREDDRKHWLKEPPQHPFPYNQDVNQITYTDFINKELIFYSKLQNMRSFRSVIDGLTRSERNVLHACFKKRADQEVNALALIHSVLEDLAYEQSTESVGQTIINMAQDFVGKNNINVLMPLGQFGTRLRGGKDAGKVEHLRTKLQDFTKVLFSVSDNTLVPKDTKMVDTDHPCHYFPILPMILVNASFGIGTGYKSDILSYHPSDIIRNIRCLLNGKEPPEMKPWFRGFRGKIEKTGKKFRISGVVSYLDGNQIDITELPIGVWTQDYKRNILEKLLDKDGEPPRVLDYTEHHTDTSVHFRVTLDRNPRDFEDEYILKHLELYKDIKETLIVLDENNYETEYKNVNELLKKFSDLRLKRYKFIRKAKLEQQYDKLDISPTDRYNLEVCRITGRLENISMSHVQSVTGIGRSMSESEIYDCRRKIEQLIGRTEHDMWYDDIKKLDELLDFDNLR